MKSASRLRIYKADKPTDKAHVIRTMEDMGLGWQLFGYPKADRYVMAARTKLFRALVDQGWSMNRVARALAIHTSMVSFCLDAARERPASGALLAEREAIEARVTRRLGPVNLWSRSGPFAGLDRSRVIYAGRRIVWRHLRRRGWSLPEIAAATSGAGHSTIFHALKPKTIRMARTMARKARVCA